MKRFVTVVLLAALALLCACSGGQNDDVAVSPTRLPGATTDPDAPDARKATPTPDTETGATSTPNSAADTYAFADALTEEQMADAMAAAVDYYAVSGQVATVITADDLEIMPDSAAIYQSVRGSVVGSAIAFSVSIGDQVRSILLILTEEGWQVRNEG